HVPGARALIARYLAGHGTAAILWLVSAVVPAPARFWLWGVAFAIDLGTPWLAVRHSAAVPPDAAHLPERFGLFTLILLGESVVAVMRGIESQEDWTPAAALSAFLGMGILLALWWWYFDGVAGPAAQPVRNHRDALRFHVWSYAHFPLYLGLVVSGVGLERIVMDASRARLPPGEALILSGAFGLVMLAMAAIGATSAGSRRPRRVTAAVHVGLAAAMVAIVIGGRLSSPIALVVTLASACLVQLGASLYAPTRAQATATSARVGTA
ncbi:MAG: low temperature requirement protein A, partial [Acidobacteriota bacterium]